jgi:hypothetical protein
MAVGRWTADRIAGDHGNRKQPFFIEDWGKSLTFLTRIILYLKRGF